MTSASTPPSHAAGARARRQLGRVLLVLGVLDLSVVAWVIGIVLGGPALGLSHVGLLLSILGGLGIILGVRIWLGVRLKSKSGELF